MIEVKDLEKDYGGHLAVDHLSFTIEDGQIYGFLGPNGAGKSTTMNIMTGYLGATNGQVLINGCDILEEPEKAKRCIGYLPEQPPLYTDMTVTEYLRFAAELKMIPKKDREAAIEEAVELTKLREVCHRLIRNLSKGYKQRVGLAQAVLGMPQVIILDEPTVGLDPKQMIEIRDLIRDLGRKHTVILSSHILSEVSAVCDHIMIIAKGKLIASDTPKNLERLMAGEKGLELLVRGDREQVEKVTSGLHGISRITMEESEETGCLKLSLILENEENFSQGDLKVNGDIREHIFYQFAEQHCPILAMQMTKASLEDVFLELTGEANLSEESGISAEMELLEEFQEQNGLEERPEQEDADDSDL